MKNNLVPFPVVGLPNLTLYLPVDSKGRPPARSYNTFGEVVLERRGDSYYAVA